jgi:hypothetical protein
VHNHMPSKMLRQFGAAVAIAVLIGCGEDNGPTIPGDDASQRQNAFSEKQIGPPMTLDDFFEEMAKKIPGGFAGMYRESNGTVVVMLVDRRHEADASAALHRFGGVRQVAKAGMSYKTAKYNFAQLRGWARALDHVWADAGVVLMDIAEERNKIVIGIKDPSVEARLPGLLNGRGIPNDAISFEVISDVVLDVTLSDTVRPVPAGMKATIPGCTLGYNAEHYIYGRTVLVNSHCTPTRWGLDGVVVPQPTGGPRIGVEVVDPPMITMPAGYGCPSGSRCRYSDAALIQYDENVAYELGTIAKPTGLGSTTIDSNDPRFWVSMSYDSSCYYGPCQIYGDSISKVGMKTGWTSGTVNGTCFTILRPGGHLLCQYSGTYNSDGGDSGSPVFQISFSPSVVAYGIHWGHDDNSGTRYYSPTHGFRHDVGNNFGPACGGMDIRLPSPYSFFC